MELPEAEESSRSLFGAPTIDVKKEFKRKLEAILSRCNLTYISGGIISDGSSASSRSLAELIKGRDIPSIDAEFNRALANVNSEPRKQSLLLATYWNLSSRLTSQTKSWKCLKSRIFRMFGRLYALILGFEPGLLQDDDLKRILSGVLSVVDGIGAFRTHASSAHGEGRKVYNLKPRHARLAINSAHTMALFVLETWDERKLR